MVKDLIQAGKKEDKDVFGKNWLELFIGRDTVLPHYEARLGKWLKKTSDNVKTETRFSPGKAKMSNRLLVPM